jgi:hypothetical protein
MQPRTIRFSEGGARRARARERQKQPPWIGPFAPPEKELTGAEKEALLGRVLYSGDYCSGLLP